MPGGTVWFREDFDGSAPAAEIKKALDQWGTDEDVVVRVLGNHCASQRIEIRDAYKQSYGKDLIEDMKDELRGDFEKIVVTMLTEPSELDAIELHDAMAGAGTDETILIEILTTKTNSEIENIKEIYQKKYDTTLEDDLNGDLDGYFRRLMVSLVCGARNENNFEIDEDMAEEDVNAFIEAGPEAWGTDEASMNKILCQRSRVQLLEFFRRYEDKMEGKTVEETIDEEVGDDLKDGFLAIVETTKNLHRFFAKRIRKCCAGWGTDDEHLIRLIVSRSEVDMEEIKEEYVKLYDKTLEEELDGETGGHYCKMLLELIKMQE